MDKVVIKNYPYDNNEWKHEYLDLSSDFDVLLT